MPCSKAMRACRRDCLHRALVEDYRAARDARDALRESDQLAPTSVPGIAHSGVALHQLEDDDFDQAVPAVTFKDFLIERGKERRHYLDEAV